MGLSAPGAQVHRAQGRHGESSGQQGRGQNECSSYALPIRFCILFLFLIFSYFHFQSDRQKVNILWDSPAFNDIIQQFLLKFNY